MHHPISPQIPTGMESGAPADMAVGKSTSEYTARLNSAKSAAETLGFRPKGSLGIQSFSDR